MAHDNADQPGSHEHDTRAVTDRLCTTDHYEAWQISSDDGLVMVSMPGGDLTIWYPTQRVTRQLSTTGGANIRDHCRGRIT